MSIETRVKVKHTIRDGELLGTTYTPQYKVVYRGILGNLMYGMGWEDISTVDTRHHSQLLVGDTGKGTAEQAIRDKIEFFERLNGSYEDTVVESYYKYPHEVIPSASGGFL